jgi:nitrogen fixation/metabolism regulation signal transduction histidine kinase
MVLLLNTAYILTAKPYLDPDNAVLDNINCVFLLVICVLTATYSRWNTDTNNKFFYGILFDAIIGLQFILNMAYVIGQVVTSLIAKSKQMRFRCKLKKRLSFNRNLQVR